MTSALLIIDMQRGLCTGAEAAYDIDAVIERINALSARARSADVPVVLIQHEEPEGPLVLGSAGWALADGLAASDDDLRVRKTTPNSFYATELQRVLQHLGATHLIICGLQTDFCVDTTVRAALALDYDVTLAADAHSTIDGVISAAQTIAHHNRTLGWLGGFKAKIKVISAGEISF